MPNESPSPLELYVRKLFAPEDGALSAVAARQEKAGLPPIQISPEEGKLIAVLLAAVGAKRVLEIGTLGGYSGVWIARSLGEQGKLTTLEIDPKHADVARKTFAEAGVAERVEIKLGAAREILPSLTEKFDAIFIDADKEPLVTYFEWGLRLVRPGGLVIADNALWGGRVYDDAVDDEKTRAVREFNRRMATDPRVVGIIVPTHDGVAFGVVR